MDQLIPIVNKLQGAFGEVGMVAKIDLPQIAVVGAQSSGKSSVLEALVGRDFLPRGSGIVTRRPLILQLHHVPKAPDARPYGEFAHKPNARFYEFADIRTEIIRSTDEEAGAGKAISRKPIQLRIHSPDVLNLTLVDLPGITKVAVGDQPHDVEVQIRDLVMEYISQKNCIILAVTAANQDLANSDAIKIAREVDPNGDRTLGVLTKLDLMDKGTDALDVLMGKVVPLKRGYIGVVNRGQQDINNNKDIRSALKSEEEFLAAHPQYSRIANRMGCAYLGKMLNAVLLQHIRETLPELKAKIHDLIAQTNTVLRQLGDDQTSLSSGALLLSLLTQYSNAIVATIDGTHTDNVNKTELVGGARINFIFTHAFGPYIMSLKPCEGLTDEHIRTTIDNAKGPRSALFIPEQAFEMLVRQQVARLEEPCLKCCDHVFDELVKICDAGEREINRYPTLRTRVGEHVVKLLREFMNPLREFIGNLIKIELAYINTNHPHFYGGGSVYDQLGAPAQALNTPQVPPQPIPLIADEPSRKGSQFSDMPSHIRQDRANMTERQRKETEVIKQLLTTYYSIVQISIQDKIPKAIVHFLVNKVKTDLPAHLVTAFYREALFEELLAESDEVAKKRQAAKKMLACLTQAAETLAEVRDFKL